MSNLFTAVSVEQQEIVAGGYEGRGYEGRGYEGRGYDKLLNFEDRAYFNKDAGRKSFVKVGEGGATIFNDNYASIKTFASSEFFGLE